MKVLPLPHYHFQSRLLSSQFMSSTACKIARQFVRVYDFPLTSIFGKLARNAKPLQFEFFS